MKKPFSVTTMCAGCCKHFQYPAREIKEITTHQGEKVNVCERCLPGFEHIRATG